MYSLLGREYNADLRDHGSQGSDGDDDVDDDDDGSHSFILKWVHECTGGMGSRMYRPLLRGLFRSCFCSVSLLSSIL